MFALEFYVKGIIQHMPFCVWLLSISIVLVRALQFVVHSCDLFILTVCTVLEQTIIYLSMLWLRGFSVSSTCLLWIVLLDQSYLWLLMHVCTCVFWIYVAAAAKLLQSYPTLNDPIDGSPPGSPVPGILQARTLEWVAISFSNAWKWKVKVKSLSRVWLFRTPWTAAYQAPPSMGFGLPFLGCHGVGCHFLLWWIYVRLNQINLLLL